LSGKIFNHKFRFLWECELPEDHTRYCDELQVDYSSSIPVLVFPLIIHV